MTRFNIGEARIVRDHNIDRKKLPLGGDALGHLSRCSAAGSTPSLPGARSRSNDLGSARPSAGAEPVFWEIVAILRGKRIPLFVKML
jgi:hypothetical protein